jgi:hypothetical protein
MVTFVLAGACAPATETMLPIKNVAAITAAIRSVLAIKTVSPFVAWFRAP